MQRREFLKQSAIGMEAVAASAFLTGKLTAEENPSQSKNPLHPRAPHFPAKAKSVIWVFLSGGYSHMETFDPKLALNKYAGKTFADTPYPNPADHPFLLERSRSTFPMERDFYPTIFPLQVGYKKHGESGIEVADWLPHLATCVDDIAFARNMCPTYNDHAAEN